MPKGVSVLCQSLNSIADKINKISERLCSHSYHVANNLPSFQKFVRLKGLQV